MQRAILFAACLVCLPCVSGCVIPYAFPKLDFTRALQLDTPPGEARVFRVDVAQSKGPAPAAIYAWERLTEIPVADTGNVAVQIKPSLPIGVYLFMGALNYDFRSSTSLALRAYRPGFELVEIESMEQTNQIVWIPRHDLAAQERALDLLLPLEAYQTDSRAGHHGTLDAGSASSAHRAALLFGAAEYERLAKIAESPAEQTRLQKKARKLKERAKE